MLETVSVVAVVGCIMVEVYQDMCPRSSSVSDNHLVEVIAVLAGRWIERVCVCVCLCVCVCTRAQNVAMV